MMQVVLALILWIEIDVCPGDAARVDAAPAPAGIEDSNGGQNNHKYRREAKEGVFEVGEVPCVFGSEETRD